MVVDPFDSAIFSIKRAKRHASDFNALAAEFMESKPYTTRIEFNAVTGLNELKIRIIRDFPEDLRGCASDAIKNIRDALDQSLSAATLVVTGKRKRHTHFPFGDSAANLEECLSGRKAAQCRDIPEELFPAIRYIKPYPHDGDKFWLKTLQRISGPHKHSVSLTIGAFASAPFGQMQIIMSDGETLTIDFPRWSSAKEEAVVATFNGNFTPELNVPFHISFDHPELKNVPAILFINRWGERTYRIIQGLKEFAAQIVAKRG